MLDVLTVIITSSVLHSLLDASVDFLGKYVNI